MKEEKKNKIYEVRRVNLPETNSSSSHSVVINSLTPRDSLPGSSYWDLPIDEDGYIHVPSRSFGREGGRYNTVLSKVQYVAGLMLTTDFDSYCQKLRFLADVIVEVSGAKDVIFDWFSDYYKEIQSGDDIFSYEDDDMWSSFGCSIDHQSMDLGEEVLESTETLKDFLLKSSSWLFLDGDSISSSESDMLRAGVLKKTDPEAYITVDVGGDIGRIDIPVDYFPFTEPVENYLNVSWFGNGTILQSICFIDGKPQNVPIRRIPGKVVLEYKGPLKEGYVYWASDVFSNTLIQRISSIASSQGQSWAKFCSSSGSKGSGESDLILELQKEMPNDVVLVPYKVETKEFGEIPV